jgi:hypothetical protein
MVIGQMLPKFSPTIRLHGMGATHAASLTLAVPMLTGVGLHGVVEAGRPVGGVEVGLCHEASQARVARSVQRLCNEASGFLETAGSSPELVMGVHIEAGLFRVSLGATQMASAIAMRREGDHMNLHLSIPKSGNHVMLGMGAVNPELTAMLTVWPTMERAVTEGLYYELFWRANLLNSWVDAEMRPILGGREGETSRLAGTLAHEMGLWDQLRFSTERTGAGWEVPRFTASRLQFPPDLSTRDALNVGWDVNHLVVHMAGVLHRSGALPDGAMPIPETAARLFLASAHEVFA